MPIINHPISPEELMAYLDGELTERQAAQASEHLRQCRDCQALAADLQAVSRNLAAWEIELPNSDVQCPPSAPASRGRRFLVDLQSYWIRYRLRAAVGVAALLVVAEVGLLQTSHRTIDQQQVASGSLSGQMAIQIQRPELRTNQTLARQWALYDRAVVAGGEKSLKIPSADALSRELPAVVPSTVAQTAQLRMVVKDFGRAREAVASVVQAEKGYIARLDIEEPPSGGRTLSAALQIPAQRLSAALAELKKLGRLESESQTGEDVGRQIVDAEARLSNLHSEEGRLNQILRERTGKLSDVLSVENQISVVRGQIEESQAEQKILATRVAYASLNVSIIEEYTRTLSKPEQPSTANTLRNAAIEGIQRVQSFCLDVLVFFLSSGPLLLLLAGVGLGVFRLIVWLRLRRRSTE